MVWLKFIACLLIILFAGRKLAQYGDVIAEKTGLGRIWIGLLVLSTITTMPELVTSISSVALVGDPDLAAGNLIGTLLLNLSILALLDIFHRGIPVLSLASPRHKFPALAGGLLLAITAASIIIEKHFGGFGIGWVGIPSLVIIIVYLVTLRKMLRIEREDTEQVDVEFLKYRHVSLRAISVRFAVSAAAIMGAGIWLSFVGEEIVQTTGWGGSFVGSLFLAISTSAPELTVSFSALRIGAIDLTVANILGANIMDIMLLVWADVAYTRGPLLAEVSTANVTTAIVGIVMSLIVVAALRFRSRRKAFVFASWYAPVLIGLYIYAAYALFTA